MLRRIRNAWHMLFSRHPCITVEVVNDTWAAEWHRMTPDDAMTLMRTVADSVQQRTFARTPCSTTIH
jgi:hypothetical protein